MRHSDKFPALHRTGGVKASDKIAAFDLVKQPGIKLISSVLAYRATRALAASLPQKCPDNMLVLFTGWHAC